MKLLRVGVPGEERPAVLTDDGRLLDLSPVASDIDGAFLASGGVDRARAAVEAGGLSELVPRQATFAPSRRPARSPILGFARTGGAPTAAPAESPSTSSTRTSGRHAESTHRTPLLNGQTLPAGALDPDGLRIGAPVARPGKVICVGLNYRDHAAETGAAIPPRPVVFMKDPGTVVGPYDEVLIPRGSVKTDWEVELGVVIGRRARYLEGPEEAAEVIAGYAVSHDVSEREFQLEYSSQWDLGKSCETFNPIGPWLVTADEAGDPQDLGLRLSVNGVKRQHGHTRDMIFPVHRIVAYLSQYMVLEPGDVINTGTPAGVALGLPGTPYLRPGDTVELEIDGLGSQRQIFGQA